MSSKKKISNQKERIDDIEAQGPHLYKLYITIKNSGNLVDGRLWVDITLKNESEHAAIDPEIFIAIALETPTGFKVLNTKSSAGVAMPPRYKGYTTIDTDIVSEHVQGNVAMENQDLFIFIAGRYKHPITGDVSYNFPTIERSIWDNKQKRAGNFESLSIEERNRLLKLFLPEYQKFKRTAQDSL